TIVSTPLWSLHRRSLSIGARPSNYTSSRRALRLKPCPLSLNFVKLYLSLPTFQAFFHMDANNGLLTYQRVLVNVIYAIACAHTFSAVRNLSFYRNVY